MYRILDNRRQQVFNTDKTDKDIKWHVSPDVTYSDFMYLVDMLNERFGPKYKFSPLKRCHGGIGMDKSPGVSEDFMQLKSFRMWIGGHVYGRTFVDKDTWPMITSYEIEKWRTDNNIMIHENLKSNTKHPRSTIDCYFYESIEGPCWTKDEKLTFLKTFVDWNKQLVK